MERTRTPALQSLQFKALENIIRNIDRYDIRSILNDVKRLELLDEIILPFELVENDIYGRSESYVNEKDSVFNNYRDVIYFYFFKKYEEIIIDISKNDSQGIYFDIIFLGVEVGEKMTIRFKKKRTFNSYISIEYGNNGISFENKHLIRFLLSKLPNEVYNIIVKYIYPNEHNGYKSLSNKFNDVMECVINLINLKNKIYNITLDVDICKQNCHNDDERIDVKLSL